MAAIDLTTLNWSNGGATKKITSIGASTIQEIKIPKWCKLVTVKAENQAIVASQTGTANLYFIFE